MSLGSLSDRVMITLRISKRYQYLVRNNSVFWLASGYSLDFGLTGGVVKTGTFNQFIRGGIAFATPPGTPLAPKRKPVSISCYKRANRKSGVNGAPLCHVKHQAPAYSRRSVLCYTARLFFAGDTPVAQHAVYFPDAFLTQMREAMPSTLSLMNLFRPANARCAAVYASIRLKSPWLISLPNRALRLVAHANSVVS